MNFDPSVSGSILTAPLPSGSKVIWHESPLCLQINPLPAWPQPSAEGEGRPCHRELLRCHRPLKDALSFAKHSLLPLHEHEMINSTGNRTIQKRPLPAGHGPRSVRSTGGRGGWGIRKLSVSTQKMGLWLESDPALALGAARIRGMNTKRGGGFNQAHISDVLPGGPLAWAHHPLATGILLQPQQRAELWSPPALLLWPWTPCPHLSSIFVSA